VVGKIAIINLKIVLDSIIDLVALHALGLQIEVEDKTGLEFLIDLLVVQVALAIALGFHLG
tara:strand:+ start:407 stop:589 length:183 start_codon:yes stop_codon:yes gene_type:complete